MFPLGEKDRSALAMRQTISDEKFAPFDTKTADAMGTAFEEAWQAISISGVEIDGAADRVREALALRIITTAQAGERSVELLRDDAIAYAMNGLVIRPPPA